MRFVPWLLTVLLLASRASAAADPLDTLRPGHPRLLLTAESISSMQQAARADPLRARLHARILEAAEKQWREPPIRYVLVGPRLLAQSRAALAHVTTNAFAFRLTGDRRYLEHAKQTMATAARFPDWNPSHFLDVAEMATALGLGYDWLYDELTPDERATIKRALLDKALAYVEPAYARADPQRESFPFVKGNLTNNWNQVCNGGFLVAALALAEDEPQLARAVIAGVRETLPFAMDAYRPDGAYPEGPVYWGYGTRFNVLILAALESALGDDFGLARYPGFDRTALFRVQVEGPLGLSFNFADGRPELGADSGLTWLGQRYGLPAIVARSRALLAAMLERPANPDDRFLATHAIWFPAKDDAPVAPLPLDAHSRGASEIALFRSAWNDPRALWLGVKAGSNRVNHGHLDLGSFVLDADGVRWALDLGPDDYDLPGYWDSATITGARWQYYRLNNHSHNTLTPGDALQQPDAVATIDRFTSTPSVAAAVIDFSAAYPEAAKRFQRGFALLDRSRVLVQDEIVGLQPHTPLTWRMLTRAHVATEGGTATLTQQGRTFKIEILAPAALRFSQHPATPPTARENQNEDVTALEAVLPASETIANVRIAILMTPIGDKWPDRPKPALAPLEDWK